MISSVTQVTKTTALNNFDLLCYISFKQLAYYTNDTLFSMK